MARELNVELQFSAQGSNIVTQGTEQHIGASLKSGNSVLTNLQPLSESRLGELKRLT